MCPAAWREHRDVFTPLRLSAMRWRGYLSHQKGKDTDGMPDVWSVRLWKCVCVWIWRGWGWLGHCADWVCKKTILFISVFKWKWYQSLLDKVHKLWMWERVYNTHPPPPPPSLLLHSWPLHPSQLPLGLPLAWCLGGGRWLVEPLLNEGLANQWAPPRTC